MKPFMREDSAEFCSSCHKVHLDVPVNSYRWARGFNDYDNWQASGVSGQGARSFYYPAESKTCADCHMPLGRFAGPRQPRRQGPLPPLPGGQHGRRLRQPGQGADGGDVEKFLKSGFITADIFAVSPVDEGKGETAMVRRALEDDAAAAQHHLRGGRGGRAGGAGRASATSARSRRRSTRRRRRSSPARRCGWTSSSAPAPSATSSRAARWTPSTSGWSSRGATPPASSIFWSGRVEDDGKGPVERGRALLPLLRARRRGQPDQQAQRLAGAQRALRPPDPARAPPTSPTTA